MLPPPNVILSKLNLDLNSLARIKSPADRSQYRAILNWVQRYQAPKGSTNLEQVRGIIQAFHHACDVNNWSMARQLLSLSLNTPTQEELDNQLQTWGYYKEQIELYTPLLGKLNSEWDAILLNGLAIAHNSLGNHHIALAYNQQETQISQTLNSPALQARALGNTVLTHHCLGKYSQAIDYYQQQLAIARNISNPSMLVQALANLGSSYYQLKQYDQALKYYQCQQEIIETLDDTNGKAKLQNNLGNVYFAKGDLDNALNAYQTWLVTAPLLCIQVQLP